MLIRAFALCITLLITAVAFADQISAWSTGQPAAGTANVLTPNAPFEIEIPPVIYKELKGETALFYFSPTCPHCQNVMSEVNGLARSGVYNWLGIATRGSTQTERQEFEKNHSPEFSIVHDSEGLFSEAVMARATPNIYIVKPVGDTTLGSYTVAVLDAYLPYSRGTAGILKIRSNISDPFADFQGYQGNLVCGSCHQQEFLSWSVSHHARAYYTLYEQKKTDDAECVECHVMGLGESTGFVMGDHHSPVRDVGCESCHSASGPHDGIVQNAKSSCEECHDDKHAIAFTYEKGLPHIDHYMANTMSEAELRTRVNALQEGTLERPLIAFPDGKTVGEAVCISCHNTVHKGDPHRNAMKNLPRKSRKNFDCVRCHATPESMGLGQQHSGYRVEEGVSCESCHGPGEEHSESPRTDNIVGLGKSCSVCVVEAVCTTCHTPEWDPDWDLDRRLQKVKSY